MGVVKDELTEIRNKWGDDRRTEIIADEEEVVEAACQGGCVWDREGMVREAQKGGIGEWRLVRRMRQTSAVRAKRVVVARIMTNCA